MWLRRVFLSLLLLLAVGSVICFKQQRFAIAFVKPNFLFPQSIAQNLGRQKAGVQGEFKLMEQLNLTPEQRQKLRGIYYQYKDRIIERKQATRQATKELRDLMVGTASSDEVRAKYKQVEAVRQQLEATSFESMIEMRDVLTPTQRSQFAQLMDQQGKISHNRMAQQRGE